MFSNVRNDGKPRIVINLQKVIFLISFVSVFTKFIDLLAKKWYYMCKEG